MVNTPLESGSRAPEGGEKLPSTNVVQPAKVESLAGLESILLAVNKIAERPGGTVGEQWSGGAGQQSGAVAQAGGTTGISPRDQAIAALPGPEKMQLELKGHIEQEVQKLHKEAVRVAKLNRPGAAYRLNELYSRIHKLNKLLSDLFDASVDVVKRIFIRVFIDRQPIL
mgnify:CR=1 FL=1